MLNAVNRLREILEADGKKVDTAVEPFGSVPGLVTYRSQNSIEKTVIKVRERLVRYDAALVRMIRDAERERCRKYESS